jgi:hypothetical protein
LSWYWDEDGSLVLRGRLTPEQGAALIAAIEALLPPRAPVAHPVPPAPDDLDERALEQEPGPHLSPMLVVLLHRRTSTVRVRPGDRAGCWAASRL